MAAATNRLQQTALSATAEPRRRTTSMLAKAVVIWVAGLLTLVPYGTYYLFFEASRDQYALLIVSVLFWIFGYWGVVGPILAAVKVRAVFRAIELARSKDELVKALQSPDTRHVAIELIAAENHIPRFLASRVYGLLVARLFQDAQSHNTGNIKSGERKKP